MKAIWPVKPATEMEKPGRGQSSGATRTTDFLPRGITIVARTGRGIDQTSSDEGR